MGCDVLPRFARAIGACPGFFAEAAANFVESRVFAGEHQGTLNGYLRDYVGDDPLLSVAVSNASPALVLEDHVPRRVLHASRAYNDFHRRYDLEQHLLVRFTGERLTTPGALAMGFTRGRRERPFGEREMNVVRLVLPALQGAARRILASHFVVEGLSRAEQRVLSVLVLGASNVAIARQLCVSVETVKTHVQRIMRKMNATSRAHVIALVSQRRMRT
jgi:DNA-binding CsgD family transcriptional regulator